MVGGFCDVVLFIHCCSSFDVVLQSLLFLNSWVTFSVPPALHPGFSGPWRPPPPLNYILAPFNCFCFFRLPRALRFWVGIFCPQVFFTLRSFPTFFTQPAIIEASLGAGSSSLKFAGLHADLWNTGPAHLFVWFTAIHNLDIQKNSFLNCTKYYHELLVVKSLVYLLLTRFKLFSLVQSICKETLNKACTACNQFDETAHQSYFKKAAKRHIKQSMFNG